MAIEPGFRSSKIALKPAVEHGVAMSLAATEYDRVVDLFTDCNNDQWTMATDCPGWDVRAMAGHLLGMAQMVATVPELVRQQMTSQRLAKKNESASIDSLTALQVAKNANLTIDDLVEDMRSISPRAVQGRRRVPALIRRARIPEAQNVGGKVESWTFGYLFDIILTRDSFMHRIDISRSTGIPMRATADHEGVLVDDVVREWADRHGQKFSLELSGPAGGTWGSDQGEAITMDAFEFCRILAGRGPATGLLAEQVPF